MFTTLRREYVVKWIRALLEIMNLKQYSIDVAGKESADDSVVEGAEA